MQSSHDLLLSFNTACKRTARPTLWFLYAITEKAGCLRWCSQLSRIPRQSVSSRAKSDSEYSITVRPHPIPCALSHSRGEAYRTCLASSAENTNPSQSIHPPTRRPASRTWNPSSQISSSSPSIYLPTMGPRNNNKQKIGQIPNPKRQSQSSATEPVKSPSHARAAFERRILTGFIHRSRSYVV